MPEKTHPTLKQMLSAIACYVAVVAVGIVYPLSAAAATPGTTNHVWDTDNRVISSPAIGPDGMIYVGSEDQNLYAFNPLGSTQHLWTTGAKVYFTPAIGSDGTIYAASADNNLYAFSPSGTTQHIWHLDSAIWSSPAIGSDNTIYVPTDGGKLYVLDSDGTTNNIYSVPGGNITALALGSDGTIYAASYYGSVYALSENGATQHVWTAANVIYSSPAIGSDGTIYVGCYDDKLYAFNSDGTTQRTWSTGGNVYSSPTIDSDGTVYVGSDDGNLYACASDGSIQHTWHTGGKVYSAPAIGSDGTIYAGSGDSNFYAFNPDGTTQHVWTTGGDISGSPCISDNGIVYVGSSDGSVYGFVGTGGTLAGTTWPKFRHDARNTGNSGYTTPTRPSVPSSVSASDGAYTNKIRITWNSVSGASSYEVWRSASGTALPVLLTETSSLTCDDSSAIPDTTYYYWVRSKNSPVTSVFGNPDTGYVEPPRVPVYRLYSYGSPESTYEHLWTISETEKDVLDSWPSWMYETVAWYAYVNQISGTTPLYRLYCAAAQQHHYTINYGEYIYLDQTDPGWTGEGIQYYVYATNSVSGVLPAYRFYHSVLCLHHFTIDETEKDAILANPSWGYAYEGIGYYVFAGDFTSSGLKTEGRNVQGSRLEDNNSRLVAPAVPFDGAQGRLGKNKYSAGYHRRSVPRRKRADPGEVGAPTPNTEETRSQRDPLSGSISHQTFDIEHSVPVPGDYNGDGIEDAAYYEELSGQWLIILYSHLDVRCSSSSPHSLRLAPQSSSGVGGPAPQSSSVVGGPAPRLVAPACHVVLQRRRKYPNEGGSSSGVGGSEGYILLQWGGPGLLPASCDYDEDGISDLAVFHEESGKWYIMTIQGSILRWD